MNRHLLFANFYPSLNKCFSLFKSISLVPCPLSGICLTRRRIEYPRVIPGRGSRRDPPPRGRADMGKGGMIKACTLSKANTHINLSASGSNGMDNGS